MKSTICRNGACRKKLFPEDRICQAHIVNGEGEDVYVPCCSEECAKAVIADYEALHRSRMLSMQNQDFQAMKLADFGRF